jgi:ATP-binding cassette, subfamily C, bacterial
MSSSVDTLMPPRGLGLIPHLFREYPKQSLLICGFLVLAGSVEGLGIATVLPLITTVSGAAGGDNNLLNQLVADFMRLLGLQQTLGNMLLVIVVAMVLKAGLVVLIMYQVGTAMAFVSTDLRFRLLRALMLARWSFFTRQSTGEIANAMTAEVGGASSIIWGATNFCTMALQVVVYLLLALLVSWQVTLAAIVGGGVMAGMLGFLIHIARRAGQDTADAYNSLLSRLVDCMGGIKAIKAMATEDRIQPMLEADNEKLFRASRKLLISKEALSGVQEPIIIIFLALGLFAATSYEIASFDQLIIMALLFHRTVSRVGRLQSAYHQLASSEGLYHALYRKTADARQNREQHAGQASAELAKAIEVCSVNFSYGDEQILHDVTLRVPHGKITAINGPSGSGKSTFIDLILGLQIPDSGEVLIDGQALSSIDVPAWRRQIGYVPQDLALFHESILNNVTLSDPEISPADVELALRQAGAWDFVSALPAGLNTVVGERGSMLSGGQRQRIAIARALARHPRLLILDEPTTALDPATEADICQTLHALKGQITVLAISHQAAIENIADIVYQLRDGRVLPDAPRTDQQQAAR